jgi:integrase
VNPIATVQKRNNSYRVRVSCGYDLNGKQIFKSATFRPDPNLTPKQEEKALNNFVLEFEKKVATGQVLDGNIHFADFAEKWFHDYAEVQLAPKTVARYKALMGRINAAIGNIKLDKIQPHHLISFYKNLAEDGMNIKTGGKLSERTIQHHHRLISAILNTAVQWQVIFANPTQRVKPPKVTQKEVSYLDEIQTKEVIHLLEDEPIKYKTVIILAIYSGLRRGELCGLKWEDINFNDQILSVRRSVQALPDMGLIEKLPKTNSSIRTMKLSNEAIILLKEYKKWQAEQRIKLGDIWVNNDYLFTQWNGEVMHPDTLTGYFSKFAKRNNLPKGISLHSLRHTNATLLIAGGMPIRTVAGRLGHAQTSTTTNIYAHALQSADAKSAEVLEDMLNPVKKTI